MLIKEFHARYFDLSLTLSLLYPPWTPYLSLFRTFLFEKKNKHTTRPSTPEQESCPGVWLINSFKENSPFVSQQVSIVNSFWARGVSLCPLALLHTGNLSGFSLWRPGACHSLWVCLGISTAVSGKCSLLDNIHCHYSYNCFPPLLLSYRREVVWDRQSIKSRVYWTSSLHIDRL